MILNPFIHTNKLSHLSQPIFNTKIYTFLNITQMAVCRSISEGLLKAFDHIHSPCESLALWDRGKLFYAFWEGDKAPVWPAMEAMHAFVPGIEGIDLRRGYLKARICWWCSRCIGGFWADKEQAWGRKRKLGFDLWVSLAGGCLWRQCPYTRMNAQTFTHAQILACSFYPSAFLAYLSLSPAHIYLHSHDMYYKQT